MTTNTPIQSSIKNNGSQEPIIFQIIDWVQYHEFEDLDDGEINPSKSNKQDNSGDEGTDELDPRYCLKVVSMFRFVNPSKEIRISGGREVNLRSLQPMGLYAANSILLEII
jgi:biotin synthase